MKYFFFFIFVVSINSVGFSQVGINNTNPKASLDITATNQANPSNTDGLLIPRIDTFPTTNPTAAQQGMMVYLTTTSGSNNPGYYYWDNNTSTWKTAVGTEGDGWYEEGTTALPNNINDNIYTNGKVGIGTNTPSSILDLQYSGVNRNCFNINYTYTGPSGVGTATGLSFHSEDLSGGTNVSGAYFQVDNSPNSNTTNSVFGFNSATGYFNTGVQGTSSGSGTQNHGVSGHASGATDKSIGGYFYADSNIGENYGIRSKAYGSTINWSGYFGDEYTVPIPGSGNVYIKDLLQVDGDLKFTKGANNNYILKTDASGNATWVNPTSILQDADWFESGGTPPNSINDNIYTQGKVAIGTTSASYKLDVRDNSTGYVTQIYNTNNSSSADGLRIRLASSLPGPSNYFIGFFRGLNTAGKIVGNGTGILYQTTSDRRLKTNINSVENSLDLISKMQPRIYEYKANLGTKEYGFIAQELQLIYPQAVSGDPNGNVETNPMMVDYSRLTPILTAAIKELKSEVDTLKTENQQLKEQLKKYENLNARLTALENHSNP